MDAQNDVRDDRARVQCVVGSGAEKAARNQGTRLCQRAPSVPMAVCMTGPQNLVDYRNVVKSAILRPDRQIAGLLSITHLPAHIRSSRPAAYQHRRQLQHVCIYCMMLMKHEIQPVPIFALGPPIP